MGHPAVATQRAGGLVASSPSISGELSGTQLWAREQGRCLEGGVEGLCGHILLVVIVSYSS